MIDLPSDPQVIGSYASRLGSEQLRIVVPSLWRSTYGTDFQDRAFRGKSRLLRANNSFKPSPLRGLGGSVYD